MAFTPADPTKAEVKITGTSPNYGFEFYIPRGAKGEPGGIVTGTLLGTSDLNEILTPGTYRQTDLTGTVGTLLRNYPYASAFGEMRVYSTTPTEVVQEFTPQSYSTAIDGRRFYRRAKSNGAWAAWRAYNSTRVDQTAGRVIYQWDDLNYREQLIYGDTGWRNVRGLFEAVCAANGLTYANIAGFSDPAIRRVGSTIYYRIGVNITGALANVDFRTAMQPAGFKTDQIENWQMPASMTGSAGVIHFSPANYIRFWTAGNQTFIMSLSTTDAWPTTLPGTAIGTIPSA